MIDCFTDFYILLIVYVKVLNIDSQHNFKSKFKKFIDMHNAVFNSCTNPDSSTSYVGLI